MPIAGDPAFQAKAVLLAALDDAEAMVAALDARGVPVAHLTFEGEGHGFRRRKTIQVALEAELTFYGRVLRFHPVHALATLKIRHLP